MTTVMRIRENHIQVIRRLVEFPVYSEIIERVLTARMMRLHHIWFGSTSRRERYRKLERSES